MEDCFVASDALVDLRVEVVGRGKSAVGRAELGRGRLSVRSSVGFDPGSEPSVSKMVISQWASYHKEHGRSELARLSGTALRESVFFGSLSVGS